MDFYFHFFLDEVGLAQFSIQPFDLRLLDLELVLICRDLFLCSSVLLLVTVELLVLLLQILHLSLLAALFPFKGIDVELGLSILSGELLVRFLEITHLCLTLLELDSCLSVISLKCFVFQHVLFTSLLKELTATLCISDILILLVMFSRLLRFKYFQLVCQLIQLGN